MLLHYIYYLKWADISNLKDKNNKLMPFRIDDDKLLGKYEILWTKIEDLNIT